MNVTGQQTDVCEITVISELREQGLDEKQLSLDLVFIAAQLRPLHAWVLLGGFGTVKYSCRNTLLDETLLTSATESTAGSGRAWICRRDKPFRC